MLRISQGRRLTNDNYAHYSIIPVFQYSNCERSELSSIYSRLSGLIQVAMCKMQNEAHLSLEIFNMQFYP